MRSALGIPTNDNPEQTEADMRDKGNVCQYCERMIATASAEFQSSQTPSLMLKCILLSSAHPLTVSLADIKRPSPSPKI